MRPDPIRISPRGRLRVPKPPQDVQRGRHKKCIEFRFCEKAKKPLGFSGFFVVAAVENWIGSEPFRIRRIVPAESGTTRTAIAVIEAGTIEARR